VPSFVTGSLLAPLDPAPDTTTLPSPPASPGCGEPWLNKSALGPLQATTTNTETAQQRRSAFMFDSFGVELE
jgi:hypothetical protein